MKANSAFCKAPKDFWANVRTISQEIGYTVRGQREIRVPTVDEIVEAFARLQLVTDHVLDPEGSPTGFGSMLLGYFQFRADVLNKIARPNFMDKAEAEQEFLKLKAVLNPKCPLPMNKQKGEKRNYAFLTGIVNMLIEANIDGKPCDYDPRSLTTITHDAKPLRTLARRVDGAFPSVVNPIAVWEIKEYYYTTTFGSRVADGVYETLLDGHELEELESAAGRKIHHVLVVDDRFTWWDCGRSYLCRMIDMLHMGYVDEVLFGREVINRLPVLAAEWLAEHRILVNQHAPAVLSGPASVAGQER